MILASLIPAVIQFPLVNSGVVLMSTIASVMMFKEKLSKRTMLGIAIGILALVLLNM